MIIDTSYFFEDLAIGQLSTNLEQVNLFIENKEPEFLEALLGYATYKDFLEGLAETVIDSKWTDLLTGAEYTDQQGRLQRWKGLIRDAGTITVTANDPQIDVVVGRGNAYDPVNNAATTIIPAALVGKPFVIQQRGYGGLRADEYSISGNVLTLLNGIKFTSGDTYFYYPGATFAIATSGGATVKKSPIANYVYFMYQKANVTSSTGSGEGKIQTQNAVPATAGYKMKDAWNRMVCMNRELFAFLYIKREVYPDWYSWSIGSQDNLGIFQTVNMFGI